MLTVTKPFFPPPINCRALLPRAWTTGQATYNSPLVVKLKAAFRQSRSVSNLLYVSSGPLARCLAHMRRLGHAEGSTFSGLSIEVKNPELHAALGLCTLLALLVPRRLTPLYHQLLAPCRLPLAAGADYIFLHSPVLLTSEGRLLAALPYVAGGVSCPWLYWPRHHELTSANAPRLTILIGQYA